MGGAGLMDTETIRIIAGAIVLASLLATKIQERKSK
jgi:hypothetical protein